MEKILITGMSGGLANVAAGKLADRYEIIGVDFRPYKGKWPYSGQFLHLDYTKRSFADIFHKHPIAKVIHLGRISNPRENFYKRYNLNVLGIANLLKLCARHQVKSILIFSTFHVYGAHQCNAINIEEDHPLRAAQIFPEIIDAVEADHLATTHILSNHEIHTVVLRPCTVVGPHINNNFCRLLRNRYVPYLMGFDPMKQFLHEDDMAQAIVLALEHPKAWGVYNVAGSGSLPLKLGIKLSGGKGVAVPHSLAYRVTKRLTGFPAHLIDYLRYPVIISDRKFREDTGYAPKIGLVDTLKSIKHR